MRKQKQSLNFKINQDTLINSQDKHIDAVAYGRVHEINQIPQQIIIAIRPKTRPQMNNEKAQNKG